MKKGAEGHDTDYMGECHHLCGGARGQRLSLASRPGWTRRSLPRLVTLPRAAHQNGNYQTLCATPTGCPDP